MPRRLRETLCNVSSAAQAVEAVAAEARDGFRVIFTLKFTGPLVKFVSRLIWAVITRKEVNWAQEYPQGLPIELHAQVFLDE